MIDAKELFDAVKTKGIPFDSHASDLYVKVTAESQQLIEQYEFKKNVTIFKDAIDNEKWFDVPFAYIDEHIENERNKYK